MTTQDVSNRVALGNDVDLSSTAIHLHNVVQQSVFSAQDIADVGGKYYQSWLSQKQKDRLIANKELHKDIVETDSLKMARHSSEIEKQHNQNGTLTAFKRANISIAKINAIADEELATGTDKHVVNKWKKKQLDTYDQAEFKEGGQASEANIGQITNQELSHPRFGIVPEQTALAKEKINAVLDNEISQGYLSPARAERVKEMTKRLISSAELQAIKQRADVDANYLGKDLNSRAIKDAHAIENAHTKDLEATVNSLVHLQNFQKTQSNSKVLQEYAITGNKKAALEDGFVDIKYDNERQSVEKNPAKYTHNFPLDFNQFNNVSATQQQKAKQQIDAIQGEYMKLSENNRQYFRPEGVEPAKNMFATTYTRIVGGQDLTQQQHNFIAFSIQDPSTAMNVAKQFKLKPATKAAMIVSGLNDGSIDTFTELVKNPPEFDKNFTQQQVYEHPIFRQLPEGELKDALLEGCIKTDSTKYLDSITDKIEQHRLESGSLVNIHALGKSNQTNQQIISSIDNIDFKKELKKSPILKSFQSDVFDDSGNFNDMHILSTPKSNGADLLQIRFTKHDTYKVPFLNIDTGFKKADSYVDVEVPSQNGGLNYSNIIIKRGNPWKNN